MRIGTATVIILLTTFVWACEETEEDVERPPGPDHDDIYSFVDGCYTLDAAEPDSASATFLAPTDDGEHFVFEATDEKAASRFFMKATDLGTYLLYDEDEHYVVGTEDGFERTSEILSDIFTLDDDYLPGVQWELEESPQDSTRFRLRHLETEQYMTTTGLAGDPEGAAVVTLYDSDGCTGYPELTVDAEGDVRTERFDDGSVYGFVETHSHMMTNFGFGGAGIFHGAPFHPFGVEHALPSCEMFHGEEGRADLLGFAFDEAGATDMDEIELINTLDRGETEDFNHHTDGYPEFTDWPSAHDSSTHQTQYYKWIERAYKGGLRLMVQHATSNQVLCELIEGTTEQPTRYSCNDMVAADRIFEETRKMERYIDAQAGGPGEGWFRIVESPDEAREVIDDGNLAIVLGLEVSNLFDCLLTPEDGEERCDEQDVVDALDEYHDRGIRAVFPVHKYDNHFSAGDGHRGIIELGNFAQTGHFSNFTENCPDIPARFDQDDVEFGDLNDPRDDYFAEPPTDRSEFPEAPLEWFLSHASRLTGGALEGDFCQNAGLTQLGEFLMLELMERGMIIEIDHLPQRSYERAFELLEQHDYPAVGSHGSHNEGKLYELGGVSKFNFESCSDPDEPGTRLDSFEHRLELIEEADGFVAEGFGFDLNGFAGAPGPRFGDDTVCDEPQEDPVSYPFESYSGDVTFSEPRVGERVIDFNTEGLAHIGMIPELIEDVRNDGIDDEQLAPLFKSAEGYIRMWERAEERAEAISP